jgi:poly(3-hydroxybutyrate) depolymerase
VVSQLNGDPTVQKTLYSCNGADVVTGYYITDMNHSWPSTTPNSDEEAHGDKPVSIDASPMILDFFRSIRKP